MKCKTCGSRVSAVATACGQCGAKAAKKSSLLLWAIGAAFAWYAVVQAHSMMVRATEPAPSIAQATVGQTSDGRPVQVDGDWVKAQANDPMTDKPINYLVLESKNTAMFDFPYRVEGGAHLTMWLRQFSNGLVEAMFRIDKGQILCRRSDCPIAVRVDGGPVTYLQAAPSDSGASDLIFLSNAGPFLKSLKTAKNLRIGIQFYQAGIRTFDFDPQHYPGF